MEEKKESPKLKIILACFTLATAIVALITTLVANSDKWVPLLRPPQAQAQDSNQEKDQGKSQEKQSGKDQGKERVIGGSLKSKTGIEVVARPELKVNQMPLVRVRLTSNEQPLAHRKLSIFLVPRKPTDQPVSERDTDANGVVTIPLPNIGPEVVLLAEFAGDEVYAASSAEIKFREAQ